MANAPIYATAKKKQPMVAPSALGATLGAIGGGQKQPSQMSGPASQTSQIESEDQQRAESTAREYKLKKGPSPTLQNNPVQTTHLSGMNEPPEAVALREQLRKTEESARSAARHGYDVTPILRNLQAGYDHLKRYNKQDTTIQPPSEEQKFQTEQKRLKAHANDSFGNIDPTPLVTDTVKNALKFAKETPGDPMAVGARSLADIIERTVGPASKKLAELPEQAAQAVANKKHETEIAQGKRPASQSGEDAPLSEATQYGLIGPSFVTGAAAFPGQALAGVAHDIANPGDAADSIKGAVKSFASATLPAKGDTMPQSISKALNAVLSVYGGFHGAKAGLGKLGALKEKISAGKPFTPDEVKAAQKEVPGDEAHDNAEALPKVAPDGSVTTPHGVKVTPQEVDPNSLKMHGAYGMPGDALAKGRVMVHRGPTADTVIGGHDEVAKAQKAGTPTIPAHVVEGLTDEEAQAMGSGAKPTQANPATPSEGTAVAPPTDETAGKGANAESVPAAESAPKPPTPPAETPQTSEPVKTATPEPASPIETPPGEESVTKEDPKGYAIKNASMAKLRSDVGLPELEPTTGIPWQTHLDNVTPEAMAAATDQAREVMDGTRPNLSVAETAANLVRVNAEAESMKRANAEADKLVKAGKDASAQTEAAHRHLNNIDTLTQAFKKGGGEQSRSFNARKFYHEARDSDVAALAEAAKYKGEKLTPEEATKVTKSAQDLRDAKVPYEKAKKLIQKDLDNIRKARESAPEPDSSKITKDDVAAAWKKARDLAKKNASKRTKQSGAVSFLSPEEIDAYAAAIKQHVKYLIQQGADSFDSIFKSVRGVAPDHFTDDDLAGLIHDGVQSAKPPNDKTRQTGLLGEQLNAQKALSDARKTGDRQAINDAKQKFQEASKAFSDSEKNRVKKPRTPPSAMGRELTKARSEAQAAHQREIEKLRPKNKVQRAFENQEAFTRNARLLGATVYAKLGSLAAQTPFMAPVEHSIEGAAAKIWPKLAEASPTGSGWDNEAEVAAAKTYNFTNKANRADLWDNVKSVVQSGHPNIYWDTHPYLSPEERKWGADFLGRTHALLKIPEMRAAAAHADILLTKDAMKKGIDTNSPEFLANRQRGMFEASMNASMMGDTGLYRALKSVIGPKPTDSPTKAVFKSLGRTGAGFYKVPAAIFQRGLDTSPVGLGEAAIRALAARGKELSPAEATRIRQLIGRGTLGTALMALGYANRDNLGGLGFSTQPDKNGLTNGDMKLGDYQLPHWMGVALMHSPWGMALQQGANFGHAWDKGETGIKDYLSTTAENIPGESLVAGAMEAAGGHGGESQAGSFLGRETSGLFVPQALREYAKSQDKSPEDYAARDKGGFFKSLASSFPSNLTNLVGAKGRQDLPYKTGEPGKMHRAEVEKAFRSGDTDKARSLARQYGFNSKEMKQIVTQSSRFADAQKVVAGKDWNKVIDGYSKLPMGDRNKIRAQIVKRAIAKQKSANPLDSDQLARLRALIKEK